MTAAPHPVGRAAGAEPPARRRSAQHQLRGRQHLRQGHRHRPRHRPRRRADVGQGLRRRPRHPHRGRPRRAPAGPAARARPTSTRASSARTRWSPRSTTACTARAAPRRPSTPPCTAWSTPPHVDHLHPDSGIALACAADGEALTEECFGDQRGLGALAPPRLPARPGHRRRQGGQPAGHRLHPRRPRHHRLGRHLRGVRGATRCTSSAPPRSSSTERGKAEPFGPVVARVRAAARGRAPRRAPPRWPR